MTIVENKNTNPLHEYVCMNPYRYIDLQTDGAYICCPSWSPTQISDYSAEMSEVSLLKDWNEGVIDEIRISVADGSYSHCDHTVCPHLNKLLKIKDHPGSPFITRDDFNKILNGQELETFVKNFNSSPEEIVWGFDRACNLRCPSCREDLVLNDKEESSPQKKRRNIVNLIDKEFSRTVVTMLITGSGDPFYSRIFRDYLKDFDVLNYPKLENIQIITNGILLNQKMWLSLKARPFIKVIEFSVDAGTKDTYENVTRLGGDWFRLLENIEYIATQPEPQLLIFSMVVSQFNFTEMLSFYQTFSTILERAGFQGKVSYNYRRHVYWGMGKYSPDDIRNISVFDLEHPLHKSFLQQLDLIHDLPNVSHNFHDTRANL
jgi:sulfatase maturation enzyme AslB (radical SAM superfamily)